MINYQNLLKKQNKRPSISFYNKYLINSIDSSKDSDNIRFNSFYVPPNNPLKDLKTFNKPKKDLVLAKLNTSNLHRKQKNKNEDKNKLKSRNIQYDDSEGFLMAAKLSSSFRTERSNYDSRIYYPKKKIMNRTKNEEIFYNNVTNITKEKTNSISENDIFEASPLEKLNKQLDIQTASAIKFQSLWRKYLTRKKLVLMIKINRFQVLLNKYFIKYKYNIVLDAFDKILNLRNESEKKVYYKKLPNKKAVNNNVIKLIKKSKSFKLKELQIEAKINQISIIENTTSDKLIKNKTRENKDEKKFNINAWIKLPFCLEKYIKKKVQVLYYHSFMEKLKNIQTEKIKQKRAKLLSKIIHSNNIKIIRKYMNIYKEKIIIEKTRQNIYYSIMNKNQKSKNKNIVFNFQIFYKENLLRDIIEKYRYTTVVQKYYFLWKKKMKEKKSKKLENKKKRVIKIKIKKKTNNDLNIGKEDNISNISTISNNVSNYNISNMLSSSMQSINNIKGCLNVIHKKMRITKITVDPNYYNYIGKKMKSKILHFKFHKKTSEQDEKHPSTKNYESIYNNILNGQNLDKIPEVRFSLRKEPIRNKNKIKHISKLNSFNNSKEQIQPSKAEIKGEKAISNISKKSLLSDNKIKIMKSNEINNVYVVDNEKEKDKKDKEDNHFISDSKKLLSKKLNVSLTQQFKIEKNLMNEFYISTSNSYSNKNKLANKIKIKRNTINNKNTSRKQKLPFMKPNKSNDIEINYLQGKKKNKNKNNDIGTKKNKEKNDMNFKPKKKQFSSEKNTLIKKISKDKKSNVFKKKGKDKKLGKKASPYQIEKLIYKNDGSKISGYNNKITINDNNLKTKSITCKNNLSNINCTIKGNSREKKFILNNTNRNININININNINEGNISKKESDYFSNGLRSKTLSSKNNFNNNITTVNIINNNNSNEINNYNNKKKLIDYHLLFYNKSNKNSSSPYLQKVNGKGIKIQSININLGEDIDKNNYKYTSTNTNNNSEYNSEISNNINKDNKDNNTNELDKETKSEYECYREMDDFWSNRSLTNFSCKTGYTLTRKLRSLNRERDRIKLMNQNKKDGKDIDRIGDKLLNIVNNFHNNTNALNLKKNRKNLGKRRDKSKINKKLNYYLGDNKNKKVLKKNIKYNKYK